jgi:hypothetical protein
LLRDLGTARRANNQQVPGDIMKKTAIGLIALVTLAYATAAWAACPMGTRYTCQQGFNGKVVCSCS